MDLKLIAIAALGVGALVQTHRARYYRQEAERISKITKTIANLYEVRYLLDQQMTDLKFDEIIKDF